jgi:hypothetical protein
MHRLRTRLLCLITCFVVASCAVVPEGGSANRDQDRPNGFYTGVTGGLIDTMGH